MEDVKDLEINKTLFDIGANKAPHKIVRVLLFGSHSGVYIVGQSIVMMVKIFSLTGQLSPKINKTLPVLIHKITSLESFSDLHLVSLCNVVYKILTKLIAHRLIEIDYEPAC